MEFDVDGLVKFITGVGGGAGVMALWLKSVREQLKQEKDERKTEREAFEMERLRLEQKADKAQDKVVSVLAGLSEKLQKEGD